MRDAVQRVARRRAPLGRRRAPRGGRVSEPVRVPPPPGPPLPFSLPRFERTILPSGLAVSRRALGQPPHRRGRDRLPGRRLHGRPAGPRGHGRRHGRHVPRRHARRRRARQLAEALDDLAAVADVSAGTDSTVARLYVLESDLDAGLALFAEILTEATFPEEEFDKSRRRLIATLQEQRSEPDFLARERLYDRLYPGHPYGTVSPDREGSPRPHARRRRRASRGGACRSRARRSSSRARPIPAPFSARRPAPSGACRRRRASRASPFRPRRASRAFPSTS